MVEKKVKKSTASKSKVVNKTSTKKSSTKVTKPQKKVTIKKTIEPEKVVENMRKKRNIVKKDYNFLFIYGSLVVIFLILSNSISSISLLINGVDIYLSVFTYPLVFLFTLLIYDKYGLEETIETVILAFVVQMFMFMLRWVMFSEIELGLFVSSLASFVISETACLTIYSAFKKNKLVSFMFIFVALALPVILDNLCSLYILKLFDMAVFNIDTFNISSTIKLFMILLCSYVFEKN